MIDPVPGFVVPLHRALTEPILLGGAPRSIAILNGTLAAVIAFAGAPLIGIAVGIVGHIVGVFLAKRDPDAIDVLKRAMRIPNRFD